MRLLLSLILALWPALVLAQGTVLQSGSSTQSHVPAYANSGSSGSQAIVLDSGSAAGGGPGVGLSELNITARGAAGAGTGPLGTIFCVQDAASTSSSGYHYLCFSANVAGAGLITYGAAGIASPQALNFNINGTTVAPVTCSGSPTSSFATVNGIVTHC